MTECKHKNAHECDCGAKCCYECKKEILASLKAELEEKSFTYSQEPAWISFIEKDWKQIWAKRLKHE